MKIFPDKPNYRSSHSLTTPSSGGLSFLLSTLIIGGYLNNFLFLISLPLSVVGLIDDKYKISAIKRYFIQALTVFLIVVFAINQNINAIDLKDILFIIFLIIFGTAIINFINFMDGIDGLVAGCFLVITITSSLLFEPSLTYLSASLFAFLLFNWNPAKVFMGDIGSTFLGFCLVLLIYKQNNIYDIFKILCISSPLLLDAITTLVRRLMYKQNIFKPHKSHLYQRLSQAGWNHSDVSKLYMFFTILISLSCIFDKFIIINFILFITLITGIILDMKKAIPFEKSLIVSKKKINQ